MFKFYFNSVVKVKPNSFIRCNVWFVAITEKSI